MKIKTQKEEKFIKGDMGCINKKVLDRLKEELNLPLGWLTYTSINDNSVISIGNKVSINLSDNDEFNIKKMEEISSLKNFLFWDISDTGKKFWDKNIKQDHV